MMCKPRDSLQFILNNVIEVYQTGKGTIYNGIYSGLELEGNSVL
jgi:hypothetical protein